jgi:hypothetical protein
VERPSISLAFFATKQSDDNFLTGSIPDDIAPLRDLIVLSLGELRSRTSIMLVLRLAVVSDDTVPSIPQGRTALMGLFLPHWDFLQIWVNFGYVSINERVSAIWLNSIR